MVPPFWKLSLILFCLPSVFGDAVGNTNSSIASSVSPDAVCIQIGNSVSSASAVYHSGDALYDKGIFHHAASSTQNSTCVVEAGSPSDVGKILNIVGRTRTPFAVKGGGHTYNPGFSSTTGVQISMYRFSEINYNATSNTVDIGAGLIWDDVYAVLEPLGVNVLGGRVTGVGVAGFTLGGGYSYKTSQYGLAVDSVVAFQLVKPNGNIVTVTKQSDPELFFGLKGGQNNFGIVTKFTVKAYQQTQVWGGIMLTGSSSIHAVEAAAAAYEAFNDPKAALIFEYVYQPTTKDLSVTITMFYDAPTPPPGLFDAFLAIPSMGTDIKTRSFLDLVQLSAVNLTQGTRQLIQGFTLLDFTPGISELLKNETLFWGETLTNNKGAISVSYTSEFFLPNIYSLSNDTAAFPPVRDIPFKPYVLNYIWESSEFDADYHEAAVASSAHIREVAVVQGQTDILRAPIYPNYALSGTALEDMYGVNVPALHALKARVDPQNVMGLAGGWKF